MFTDENYTKIVRCSNERGGGGVDIEIKLATPDRCMLHIYFA